MLDHPTDPIRPQSGTRQRLTPPALARLIETLVASVFGIAAIDLSRPSRGRAQIALARQVAMYLARVVGRLRFDEVARVFGRDRSTVRHACHVVEDRRDDPDFNLTLDHLESIIKRISLMMAQPRITRLAHP